MNLITRFFPWEYVESVYAIDYPRLYADGYRALIFDIDNTLVHHGDDSNLRVDSFLQGLQAAGWKLLFLSNNSEQRIRRFNARIGADYIYDACKPSPAGFHRALEKLAVGPDEALVIGDQVFTDIRGANAAGIANILVRFIRLDSEKHIGKRRQLERLILWLYHRCPRYLHRLGDVGQEHQQIP